MKWFQTGLLIFFGFFIILAVMIFSGIVPLGKNNSQNLITQPVVMWGTISRIDFEIMKDEAAAAGDDFAITYVEKNPQTIEAELIDALASGVGPDLLLGPHTLILKQRDKFLPLPYTAIPERLYRDSFVEATEVLLSADHTLALPVYLDPIVMYWNRDLFSKAGIASVPSTWLDVQALPEKLTVLDDKGNIKESAVALGGVENVAHFKEILISQIMQTGSPIVLRTRSLSPNGLPQVVREVILSADGGAQSALRFYVEFTNPGLKKYSWNSAMKNSFEEFISGRLGVYFGFASELSVVKSRNPHLNFDIALVPQIQLGGRRATYADIHSLAILKSSKATQSAFAVAYRIALGAGAGSLARTQMLPPVRRDLVTNAPADPLLASFYSSAIIGKAWEDPDYLTTRNIFADMIESVTIGKSDPNAAVSAAETRLRDLVRQIDK